MVVAENLKELYETGRAGFIIRGKVSNEDNKGKPVIVITEIPYQTNKAEMVKQIAELVNEKKLPDFDFLIGSWVKDPLQDKILKEQRKIDKDLWK